MVEFFFTPLSHEEFVLVQPEFLFLTLADHPSLTLGELLLNIIYTHEIMDVPGIGVFVQIHGWAMGTNTAPVWTTLVLRMYEKRKPAPHHMCMSRFIDDGIVLHYATDLDDLVRHLHSVYPPKLAYQFEFLNRSSWVHFMECMILWLPPLRTSIYFKATHSCSYIPWSGNTPRHTKEAWLKAECVRYLRVCSHQNFYNVCVARLRGAITRLNCPKSVAYHFQIPWQARSRYLPHGMGPKQEVGGRVLKRDTIHVFRAPYHMSIGLRWPRMMRRLQCSLPMFQNLQLFTVLRTTPNLGKAMLKLVKADMQAHGTKGARARTARDHRIYAQ